MFMPRYGYKGGCTAVEWLEELGETGLSGLHDDDRQKLTQLGVIHDGKLDRAKLHLLTVETIVPDAEVDPLPKREFEVVDASLLDMHPRSLPKDFGHSPDHPLWRNRAT